MPPKKCVLPHSLVWELDLVSLGNSNVSLRWSLRMENIKIDMICWIDLDWEIIKPFPIFFTYSNNRSWSVIFWRMIWSVSSKWLFSSSLNFFCAWGGIFLLWHLHWFFTFDIFVVKKCSWDTSAANVKSSSTSWST